MQKDHLKELKMFG